MLGPFPLATMMVPCKGEKSCAIVNTARSRTYAEELELHVSRMASSLSSTERAIGVVLLFVTLLLQYLPLSVSEKVTRTLSSTTF